MRFLALCCLVLVGVLSAEDLKPLKDAPPLPKASDSYVEFRLFMRRELAKFPDKNRVWDAVASFQLEEQKAAGIYYLCEAIASGQKGLSFGTAQLILELAQKDRLSGKPDNQAHIKVLTTFLQYAAKDETDGEALANTIDALGTSGDRSALPLVLRMLGSPEKSVQESGMAAFSNIALVPQKDVTLASARDWITRNQNTPDGVIYSNALQSSDATIRMKAVERLIPSEDQRLVPVLAEVIGGPDNRAAQEAGRLLTVISGLPWSGEGDQKARQFTKKKVENWWKGELKPYRFPAIASARKNSTDSTEPTKTVNPNDQVEAWIMDLDSLDTAKANAAFTSLMAKGKTVVGKLVQGLRSTNSIRVRKCSEILQRLSGQNKAVEHSDPAEKQEAAIKFWEDYAAKQAASTTP